MADPKNFDLADEAVGEELADIFALLVRLADQLEIDLPEAVKIERLH